jgi:hypothetical protein
VSGNAEDYLKKQTELLLLASNACEVECSRCRRLDWDFLPETKAVEITKGCYQKYCISEPESLWKGDTEVLSPEVRFGLLFGWGMGSGCCWELIRPRSRAVRVIQRANSVRPSGMD